MRGSSLFAECSPSQPCQGLGPHAHFRDFGSAMLTLFRIATGDNWNGILEVSEPVVNCYFMKTIRIRTHS